MGCQQTESSSQVLEAMNWYFGGRECRMVTFVDDVASSLAGQEWEVNVIDANYEEKKYLVYLDDGIVSAPTPAAGQTLVAINYSPDDTAEDIALAFEADMDAAGVEVMIELDGASAEYQNKFLGNITAEVLTNAALLTFASEAVGFGGSIGAVAQGGAELSTEQSFTEVTSDTTGSLILDKIFSGGNASITLTLAEMTTERWKDLVGNTFGSIVTVNATELVGFGDDKLYKSAFTFAGQLVGHPIRLPNSDRSADIIIPKTVPELASVNYSGQDIQGAEFTFSALRDTSKPAGARLFARGDHSLI